MKRVDNPRITIPYGRQWIDEEDIRAVVAVLRSDWLTTGPKGAEFEGAVTEYVGAGYGVAVNSGTAGLHCAMFALGIGPGDEVIVPPMTFAATANCVAYMGARPVFADVDPGTLLIDPAQAEARITPKTRAIIGVDYAGQPCDWDALRDRAKAHRLALVADGCHALGAEYKGRKVGTLADMTVFSFHPVKHITTGEGGMVVTDDPDLAEKMRIFRNHGITVDDRQRTAAGSWFYELDALGYNYRITDFQCALGISQLRRLPEWLARRRQLAGRYGSALASLPWLRPLSVQRNVAHAYHLYVIRIDAAAGAPDRNALFGALRNAGIGVNVHYIPVHLHPYYQRHLGTGPGQCPVAEAAYEEIISLPLYPGMSDADQDAVIALLKGVQG
ncbi:MAG: UDP-4-amino-4,6-dideoxy-N-acetyl-beta-L-altrosamine transaminase [Syntrophales bacterium]